MKCKKLWWQKTSSVAWFGARRFWAGGLYTAITNLYSWKKLSEWYLLPHSSQAWTEDVSILISKNRPLLYRRITNHLSFISLPAHRCDFNPLSLSCFFLSHKLWSFTHWAMLHILSNDVISRRVLRYSENAKYKPELLVPCICQSHSMLFRKPSVRKKWWVVIRAMPCASILGTEGYLFLTRKLQG